MEDILKLLEQVAGVKINMIDISDKPEKEEIKNKLNPLMEIMNEIAKEIKDDASNLKETKSKKTRTIEYISVLKDKYLDLCENDLNGFEYYTNSLIESLQNDDDFERANSYKDNIKKFVEIAILGIISILSSNKNEDYTIQALKLANFNFDSDKFISNIENIPELKEIKKSLFLVYEEINENFLQKDFEDFDNIEEIIEYLREVENFMNSIIQISVYPLIAIAMASDEKMNDDIKKIEEFAEKFYNFMRTYSLQLLNEVEEEDEEEDMINNATNKITGEILYSDAEIEVIKSYEDDKIHIKSKVPVVIESVNYNEEANEYPKAVLTDIDLSSILNNLK